MAFVCKLCGASLASFFTAADAKSRQALAMANCSVCSLVQQKDIPSDEQLRIYYSHNYRQDYKSTYEPKLKYVRRAGLAAQDRIGFLQSAWQTYAAQTPGTNTSLAGKRLLDIGAGGGEVVYLASQAGFLASGVEPNEGYSDFAKRVYGVDIQTMMLANLNQASADVVTLFHVFEHMANPHTVIQKIAEVLTPNGLFLIEVPNILQKDASPHNVFFKAHLFYYNRYSLLTAASRYFDVVKLEDSGNLKILLIKKTVPQAEMTLPQAADILQAAQELRAKGWWQYAFAGGGIYKPFRRLRQIILELRLDGRQTPRALLDSL